MPEDPGRVVLEFEVILRRWDQFIPSATLKGLDSRYDGDVSVDRGSRTYMSNVDFCLASKSASVKGRSSFAFVRETDTRMPVSML